MKEFDLMKVLLRFFLALMFSLSLGSCGLFGSKDEPPPPPPPTRVELKIEAAKNANPNAEGIGSPTLLRVYELRNLANFNNADFFALYEKDQSTLASDLVVKQEFLLKPGEQRELAFDTDKDTQFIALFAAFRKLDDAQWRLITPLPPNQTTLINAKIDEVVLSQTVSQKPMPKPDAGD